MIIADFECKDGHINEHIVESGTSLTKCPVCGKQAKRIITINGVNTANEDSAWIRSTLEVVDKENPAPHVQDFVNNPTRSNLKNWMKNEGLRYLEPGEEKIRKPEVDVNRIKKEVYELQRKNKRIEVRGDA